MEEQAKTVAPVFLPKAGSFWFGILPLALTLIDSMFASAMAGENGGPVAAVISTATGFDQEQVRGWLLLLAPVWGLIIAQQRAGFGGLPRPYTLNPQKEQEVQKAVDGAAVFDAGVEAGKQAAQT